MKPFFHFLLTCLVGQIMSAFGSSIMDNIKRACTVYCEGEILHYVQISGVFNDSKTFVDMPMRVDPENVVEAFSEIPDKYNPDLIRAFLDEYFYEADSDLDEWIPPDMSENPDFIDAIDDDDYRAWATSLNELWLVLGRQVNESAVLYPQRTSFVPRQYPMIVPGGRFGESYYWDSWWIVRGLLVCDMAATAEYVVKNLLDDLQNFGFVPNGGRIYYLDRSQPPLLSEMVMSIVNYYGWGSANATSLLTLAYPLLESEYRWWMDPATGHTSLITVPTPGADEGEVSSFVLNHFHSNSSQPRPESYLADIETAGVALDSSDWNYTSVEQRDLYTNIRSGAETGWDFSSRWLAPTSEPYDASSPVYNLSTIDTIHIVPVDLNSYMYRLELNLAKMAQALYPDDPSLSDSYTDAANARADAIQAVLWNGTSYRWNDYNISARQQILGYGAGNNCVGGVGGCEGEDVSVSSWIPLWAGLLNKDIDKKSVVDALQSSGLIQDAGVLTTSVSSGQQWDSPDAWAPLVLLVIEGLQTLNNRDADNLATDIGNDWLNTCYLAFNRTGYMFEKYNAFLVGVGGGGGEYTPQIGFGWSNGVALVLLEMLYVNTKGSGSNNNDDDVETTGIALIVVAVVVVVCAAMVGGYYFRNSLALKKADGTSEDKSHLTSRASGGNIL